ncbi:MAG: NfeD family protein [Bryobacteraceae bacterium]
MIALSIPWWIWVGGGLLLMAAETLLPTSFYAFFFGLAAVVTGGVVAAGLANSFEAQGITLVIVGIGAVLLRKPVIQRFQLQPVSHDIDTLVGETAYALQLLQPGAVGKAELRGTTWNALNVGETPIIPQARCQVEKVDGLTIHIRA